MSTRIRLWLALLATLALAGPPAAWWGPELLQRRILFPFRGPHTIPASTSGRLLTVSYDHGTVPAVLFRPRLGEPLVVWFHGSGETIANQVRIREQFAERDLGLAAIEYPGFGGSTGAGPSEATILESARAGLAQLQNEGLPRPVCVGASFGTGVALAMAAEDHCSALILASPYTSLPAVVDHHWPGRGVDVWDQFDALPRARAVFAPALVFHGLRDTWVPYAQGEAVAAALEDARFVTTDASHLDLFDRHVWDTLASFAHQHGDLVGGASVRGKSTEDRDTGGG
jgi:pimeloyl-ACP methyl ester carboxylesterase